MLDEVAVPVERRRGDGARSGPADGVAAAEHVEIQYDAADVGVRAVAGGDGEASAGDFDLIVAVKNAIRAFAVVADAGDGDGDRRFGLAGEVQRGTDQLLGAGGAEFVEGHPVDGLGVAVGAQIPVDRRAFLVFDDDHADRFVQRFRPRTGGEGLGGPLRKIAGGGCGLVHGIRIAAGRGEANGIVRGIGVVHGCGEVPPGLGWGEPIDGRLQRLESAEAVVLRIGETGLMGTVEGGSALMVSPPGESGGAGDEHGHGGQRRDPAVVAAEMSVCFAVVGFGRLGFGMPWCGVLDCRRFPRRRDLALRGIPILLRLRHYAPASIDPYSCGCHHSGHGGDAPEPVRGSRRDQRD